MAVVMIFRCFIDLDVNQLIVKVINRLTGGLNENGSCLQPCFLGRFTRCFGFTACTVIAWFSLIFLLNWISKCNVELFKAKESSQHSACPASDNKQTIN